MKKQQTNKKLTLKSKCKQKQVFSNKTCLVFNANSRY